MRWRCLLGVLFALAVTCLMCLPFVVSRDGPAEPETRTAAVPPETAVMAEAQPLMPERLQRLSREGETAAPAVAAAAAPPVADANGVPILRTSYVRSNYRVFRLTGWG